MASAQQNLQLCDISNNLISEFDKRYLPSNVNILKRLLYETQNVQFQKLTNAIKTVIMEVINIWENSSITIKRIDHCSEKLKKLYDDYAAARKFHGRSSKKVNDFLSEINNVFDITKKGSLALLDSMNQVEKKAFLSKPVHIIKSELSVTESENISDEESSKINVEESGQSLSAEQTEVDAKLSQKFSQNVSFSEAESIDDANIVSATEIITRSKAYLLPETQQPSSEETIASSQSSGTVYVGSGRNYDSKNERGTINVMTPEVVAAFDKAKVSDRNAVLITSVIANALDIDLQTLILSRSSINTARAEVRKREYEKMKQVIQGTPVTFMAVHWDGKLIPDNISCKKIDRLPVLVSSDKFTKLLNVPALHDQKAKTVASAVYESLKDWGLIDLINILCCDTTNVNLGSKGGAATILEQLMEKDLLYLACRRHVFELLLRAAYEIKFPGTSGPDVPIFKKFRDEWSSFNLKSFQNGLAGLETSLKNEVPRVTEKIQKFLKEHQPRDDYKELLELSLIFLGVGEEITFKKPGAIHHARWMAKAIYSIKMYLFRKSFKMSKEDIRKLHAVCKFIIFTYLPSWYTASLAISAPNNDLNLIKSLVDFRAIDREISDATLKKFSNHLWYLSPELTILALFDNNVDNSIKEKIVKSLRIDTLDDDDNIKKFDPSDEGIRALHDKTLDYFTNKHSLKFFKKLNLDDTFLKYDCNSWDKNPSYIECREKLKNLTVVNDCAERAIHLVQEYVNTRSRDEEQKQYLLQFVDESRRELLNSTNKEQLMKKLKT